MSEVKYSAEILKTDADEEKQPVKMKKKSRSKFDEDDPRRRNIANTTKKPYKCTKCVSSFSTLEFLEIHSRGHDSSTGGFNCSLCPKTFKKSQSLIAHMLVHQDDKPFRCKLCDISFKVRGNLKEHLKLHKGLTFKCSFCGKDFNKMGNLQMHERRHTGIFKKRFKCNLCEKDFVQKCLLSYHMRTHSGERPFKCEFCGNAFACKSNLQKHYRIHTGEKPFACDQCGKIFNQKSSLTCHKRTHITFKAFKCKHCDRMFGCNEELIVHLRIHGERKLFKCSYCELEFVEHCHLKSHIRMHTEFDEVYKTITVRDPTIDLDNYYSYDVNCEKNSFEVEKPKQEVVNATDKPVVKKSKLKVVKVTDKPVVKKSKLKVIAQKQSSKKRKRNSYVSDSDNDNDIAVGWHSDDDDGNEMLLDPIVPATEIIPTDYVVDYSIVKSEIIVAEEDGKPSEDIEAVFVDLKHEEKETEQSDTAVMVETTEKPRLIMRIKKEQYTKMNPVVVLRRLTKIKVEEFKLKNEINLIYENEQIAMELGAETDLKEEEEEEQKEDIWTTEVNNVDVKAEPNRKTRRTNKKLNISPKLKEVSPTSRSSKTARTKHTSEPSPELKSINNLNYNEEKEDEIPEIVPEKREKKLYQCDHCPKIYTSNQHLQYHKITHYESTKCQECSIEFDTPQLLRKHLMKTQKCRKVMYILHTTDANRNPITITDIPFDQLPKLRQIKKEKRTIKQEIIERDFKCDECPKMYSTNQHLQYHKIFHNTSTNCTHCSAEFDTLKFLYLHLRKSIKCRKEMMYSRKKKGKFDCEICGKKLNSSEKHQSHMYAHTGLKPFGCDYCGKYFRAKYQLRSHFTIHTGLTPFKCEVCGAGYSTAGHMKQHQLKHTNDTPFSCTTCKKEFKSYGRLYNHQKIHREDCCKCAHCGKGFKTLGNLKIHELRHTEADEENRFPCEVCGKSFLFKHKLVYHMRTHTGEKPYACTNCDARFADVSNLQKHFRIHTGLKPYKCKTCGKEFNQLGSLNSHKKSHISYKPYECEYCGRGYGDHDDLIHHLRSEHGADLLYQCTVCGKQYDQLSHMKSHRRLHLGSEVKNEDRAITMEEWSSLMKKQKENMLGAVKIAN